MPSDRNRSRSSHRSRSPPSRSHSGRYSRSRSPPRHRRRSPPPKRRRSRSPPPSHNKYRQGGEERGRGERGSRGRNNNQERNKRYEWGGPSASRDKSPSPPPVKSEEPNFGLSGKLAAETNTVKGVELKYNEPAEAAKPKMKWRLYVFKGDQQIDLLHIHRQSAFLFGRDRVVADIPIDHPSCSKQHAVLQFRLVPDPEDNNKSQVVKPFIIDLESTNGTFLNGDQIPSTRFVEMRMKDVLKFGESTREYVLLHSG
ncbi:SMAD/FHA domain-containing protein [Phascolomyces articulosus]|uniref:SMAD/FHA domain-containing protein n=1 Tax=Phascolomyces articulosus TaxID=60185 RepID=A0AAD5KF20_9FUNG|nr:SMAD/FHA domain-containing protein [Phascolomyces articulosus]